MFLKYLLISAYLILGLLNVYCFLFQRTARKIRKFAVGTVYIKLENEFLPFWYFWLLFLSFLRFVPLIWLIFIDLKIPIVLFIIIGVLKLSLPTNDFGNIQKIKRFFERKIKRNTALKSDFQLYEIVLEAEKKTL